MQQTVRALRDVNISEVNRKNTHICHATCKQVGHSDVKEYGKVIVEIRDVLISKQCAINQTRYRKRYTTDKTILMKSADTDKKNCNHMDYIRQTSFGEQSGSRRYPHFSISNLFLLRISFKFVVNLWKCGWASANNDPVLKY